MRLLIGHWKIGPTREEQNPPSKDLGALSLWRKSLDGCSLLVHGLAMDVTVPVMDDGPTLPAMAGSRLARGVARALRALDFVTVEEFVPAPGLRVDVLALGPRGEVWIVECKSSAADFRADRKWQGYLPWCDRFFWAVDAGFPEIMLPEGSGLILADAYDGEIIRMGPDTPLAAPRRKALVQAVARHAALRLMALRDPVGAALGAPL